MSQKTQKLIEALRSQWKWPDKAFITEFRGGTGWTVESRADAIAMDLWPSNGLELIGFELKTSRSDWLRELKQVGKADAIKQFCDRWYLVVDDDMIVRTYDDELPEDWGLICPDYGPGTKLKERKVAPKLNPRPIDKNFLASLMRRASNPFNEVVIDGRKYIEESLSLQNSGEEIKV